jgi:hypothetical protein
MKSINWGYKIIIVYVGFVLLILFMVFKSVGEKVELVTDNYYAKELQYQQRINHMHAANALSSPLEWKITSENVVFSFPEEMRIEELSGTITFFRPSDKKFDKEFIIKPNVEGVQLISNNQLEKGLYKIQVEWNVGETIYYKEGTAVIP